VSRWLGHALPAIAVTVYGHRFDAINAAAAGAIDAAMRP
jgi:hypothetical protein